MDNKGARGEAASLNCEQQAVGKGRKGDSEGLVLPCLLRSAKSMLQQSQSVRPQTLRPFMLLLFPMPEMFPSLSGELVFILQNLAQWPLNSGDPSLRSRISLPASLTPQQATCLLSRLPPSWLGNFQGLVLFISLSLDPSVCPQYWLIWRGWLGRVLKKE